MKAQRNQIETGKEIEKMQRVIILILISEILNLPRMKKNTMTPNLNTKKT